MDSAGTTAKKKKKNPFQSVPTIDGFVPWAMTKPCDHRFLRFFRLTTIKLPIHEIFIDRLNDEVMIRYILLVLLLLDSHCAECREWGTHPLNISQGL